MLARRLLCLLTAHAANMVTIPLQVVELEALIRPAVVAAARDRGRSVGSPAPSHGPARPGDLRSNLVDATRAGELLGWRPTMPLRDGIAATAAWFADRA